MAIPDFSETGDLPPGVHRATLTQVVERFGTGGTRRRIASRLERIHRLAVGTGSVARFVIFGSFITSKPEPNDVDVFLPMEDDFDVGAVAGEAGLVFDHGRAQTQFGASVFWIRRLASLGGEEA